MAFLGGRGGGAQVQPGTCHKAYLMFNFYNSTFKVFFIPQNAASYGQYLRLLVGFEALIGL